MNVEPIRSHQFQSFDKDRVDRELRSAVVPVNDFTDRDGPEALTLVTKPSSHERQIQVFCLPVGFRSVSILALNDDKRPSGVISP